MSNQHLVPEAREGLDHFKMEVAKELNIPLSEGYNGNLTSKQCGSVGGEMIKQIVADYESKL